MAGELRYGDKVHIQNGYDNWQGGYLDANTGSSAGPTSVYQVATAATSNRSAGSGTWQISSVSGKQPGDAVLSGDTIHLRNLFGAGSYLDVSGGAAAAQTQAAIYDVSTNSSNDRVGAGTASWRILAKTSNPWTGPCGKTTSCCCGVSTTSAASWRPTEAGPCRPKP